MYRTSIPTFVMLAMLSLAGGMVAPSSGWTQDRLAAGEPITLTPPRASTLLSINHITWSPDDTKIAFSTNGGRIFVINADGTNLVQLTNRVIEDSSVHHISWSPDGTRIAFLELEPHLDQGSL